MICCGLGFVKDIDRALLNGNERRESITNVGNLYANSDPIGHLTYRTKRSSLNRPNNGILRRFIEIAMLLQSETKACFVNASSIQAQVS